MIHTTDIEVSAAREHIPDLFIFMHMPDAIHQYHSTPCNKYRSLLIETLQLALIQITQSFFRNVDHITIFVSSLLCHLIYLLLPAACVVNEDGPVQDMNSSECLVRDMIPRVVGKTLITWGVIEVVRTHGLEEVSVVNSEPDGSSHDASRFTILANNINITLVTLLPRSPHILARSLAILGYCWRMAITSSVIFNFLNFFYVAPPQYAGPFWAYYINTKEIGGHQPFLRPSPYCWININGLLLTVLGVICLLSASGCAQSGHFCF